jgi:hypothetical protein
MIVSRETFTKSFQIFTTAYTCDIMTTREISWFFDFICILYNLKTIRRKAGGHVIRTKMFEFWHVALD